MLASTTARHDCTSAPIAMLAPQIRAKHDHLGSAAETQGLEPSPQGPARPASGAPVLPAAKPMLSNVPGKANAPTCAAADDGCDGKKSGASQAAAANGAELVQVARPCAALHEQTWCVMQECRKRCSREHCC